MDGITFEQFNAVFGDLKKSQETQTRTLASIQNIVSEKIANVSEHLVALTSSINSLAKSASTKQAPSTKASAVNNNQQGSTDKINKTITNSFKALTSSFLTREGKLQADRKPAILERRNITTEGMPTRAEKQIIRLLGDTNSKTAALLKEVHTQKTGTESGGGGLFKFLSPFLLLFGGIAALSYGAMKLPGVGKLFQEIKSGGIKQTLVGLINKIKPQDKSITQWLRGLPLVGRFFDVYDGVMELTKGNWKQGLKHLAFAIPGAELLAEIIAGKGAKAKVLAPGGATDTLKGVSLKGIWSNIQMLVGDAFAGISTTFKELREIFGLVTSGDQTKMVDGFSKLAQYFPMLSPVAEVFKTFTGDVFKSSFAKTAQKNLGVNNVKFGDVVKVALDNVYEKISNVFKTIGSVFGVAMEVVGSLGDVFSGDYSKQSAALNKLDKISPGTSSMLRQILTITDEFNNLGITDQTSFTDKMIILAKAGLKGATAKSTRYSRSETLSNEAVRIGQSAETEMDPTKRIEMRKNAAEMQLESTQIESTNITKRVKELSAKREATIQELMAENKATRAAVENFDKIFDIDKQLENTVLPLQAINTKMRLVNEELARLDNTAKLNAVPGNFSAKKQPFTLGGIPQSLNQTGIDATDIQQTLGNRPIDISAASQTQIPTVAPDTSVGDALQSLPFDELSNLKYMPIMAQILKDQNKLITDLIRVNEEQPAPNFTSINGGPNISVGTSNNSKGEYRRGAF